MSSFRDTISRFTPTLEPLNIGRSGAQRAVFENGVKGVLKPARKKRTFVRGVPTDGYSLREVATYRLDRDLLRFDVVPETIRVRWGRQEASIQRYVEGASAYEVGGQGLFDRRLPGWKERVVEFARHVSLEGLRRLAVLDLLINNVDRHPHNVVFDTVNDRVWAIDNAQTFPEARPLFGHHKNVFHTFLFFNTLELPPSMQCTLAGITLGQLKECLGEFLPPQQIEQTYWRTQFVLEHSDRLAFSRLSPLGTHSASFPTYKDWYTRRKSRCLGWRTESSSISSSVGEYEDGPEEQKA